MASIAMDISDGYLEGEEDSDEYISPQDFMSFVLFLDRNAYVLADLLEAQDAPARTADIIPSVGVVGASDDSELAQAVAETLVTVEAPSDGRDCPICLQDDDTAAWKETPCGHRFHGPCVERWLQAKGSCPMCRTQVVTMPTAAATNIALELERSAAFEVYHQIIIANSAFMEDE
ncbi:unnamed protein product [Alopecurus aequalis]